MAGWRQGHAAGLSNQITRAIDGAYLANTTAKGPSGLLSIGYTGVETGTSLSNLDPFVAARYAAKSNGSDLTSWIVSPAQAEALSKLKIASGSNQSLIQFVEGSLSSTKPADVTQPKKPVAKLYFSRPDSCALK